jgi:hypothetical protein
MKNSLLISYLFISLIPGNFYAQSFNNVINGTVKDLETSEVLPYVNIFISYSTWGTTSDLKGSFELTSIRPGNYELVFSMIGYETVAKSVQLTESSDISFYVLLKKKIYEIDEVKISGNRPDEWFHDLELFKEKFFGYYSKPIDCKIENEFYIEFNHPSKDILTASCSIPLEIENTTLGYDIKCEIIKFEYNYFTKSLNTNYKLYFSDKLNDSSYFKQESNSIRENVYKGSLYYFLQELISGKFIEAGFVIYNTGSVNSYSSNPGIKIESTDEILEKNISDDSYILHYDDYLDVSYYSNFYKVGQSWIKLNYSSVTIDKYGYPLDEFAFTLYGSWAKRGVSTLLPINFEIDEDEE